MGLGPCQGDRPWSTGRRVVTCAGVRVCGCAGVAARVAVALPRAAVRPACGLDWPACGGACRDGDPVVGPGTSGVWSGRVPGGASCGHHGGGMMARGGGPIGKSVSAACWTVAGDCGGCVGEGGQLVLPVPLRGVRRVRRDDGEPPVVGHPGQRVPGLGRGQGGGGAAGGSSPCGRGPSSPGRWPWRRGWGPPPRWWGRRGCGCGPAG